MDPPLNVGSNANLVCALLIKPEDTLGESVDGSGGGGESARFKMIAQEIKTPVCPVDKGLVSALFHDIDSYREYMQIKSTYHKVAFVTNNFLPVIELLHRTQIASCLLTVSI